MQCDIVQHCNADNAMQCKYVNALRGGMQGNAMQSAMHACNAMLAMQCNACNALPKLPAMPLVHCMLAMR